MHQPYDRVLKQISARAARSLLEIAGILPVEPEVTLRPLEREVAGPALRTDQLFAYQYVIDWVVHIEFEARWQRAVMPGRMARYQKVITLEYPGVEVNSVVFVLRPEGCPEAGEYRHREGEFSPVTEVRYRIIRMWELDASRILAGGDDVLLPVAALMDTTDDQVRQIASRVSGNREAAAEFLALAVVRYDKDQIEKILGDNPMFTKAILKESWAVQELIREGRDQGRDEGRAKEARETLARVLANRFPGLDMAPELDAISDAAVLQNLLLEHVIGGSDRETAIQAIRDASRR